MAKVQEDEPKKRRPDESDSPGGTINIPFNLGGLLGGLGGLVEKLGELAKAGEELSQSGEFKDASGKVRGVYGVHVKTGIGEHGEQELKVEPFGNVRPRSAEEPADDDVREPLVDIHEEEDHLLVLAELPGVDKDDVTLELVGDRLNLSARRGKVSYCKEIVLPQEFSPQDMHWECKNGILQVQLKR
jgi:HSP20 family protein